MRNVEPITLRVMVLLLLFIVPFFCIPPRAVALDSPHNPGYKAVSCASCHLSGDASWWADQENNICGSCHNDVIAVKEQTHRKDSGIIVQCVGCHHPHEQRQDRRWGATSLTSLYTGTSDSTPGSITATTLKKSDANWADHEWKGKLLLPDVRYPAFIYHIDDNTSTTITISTNNGDSINTSYCLPGATFAIVYGKFIKDIVNNRDVKFFRPTDANSFADNDAVTDGICQVCHNSTTSFNQLGTLEGPGHPSPAAGKKCTSCHDHKKGFKQSCTVCHGNPPVDSTTMVSWNGSSNGTTGSQTAGAHTKHATTAGMNYECVTCHVDSAGSGSTHNQSFTITLGFSGVARSGVSANSIYNGQQLATYNTSTTTTVTQNTGTAGNGSLTCSNIYCHSTVQANGGSGAPTYKQPVWDDLGSVVCGSCHKTTAAAPGGRIDTGSHSKHLDSVVNSISVQCGDCHTGAGDGTSYASSNHVNNNIEVGSSYPSSNPPGNGYSTCSTASCHVSAYGSSYVTTPTWGDAGNCGICHPIGADGAPATGSHTKHMAITTPSTPDCSACHAGASKNSNGGTQHIDGNIDVTNGYPSNVAKHAAGSGYSSCSSASSCHDNGRGVSVPSPVWGTSNTDCSACHAKQPPTGSHTKHLSTTLYAKAACGDCHANAVEGTTPPSTHLNSNVDVFDSSPGDLGYPQSVPKHNDNNYSNCSSAYCHSPGQNSTGGPLGPGDYATVTWGQTAPCGSCHKVTVASGFASGSHTRHLAQSGIGCGKCHAGAANDASSYDSTSHVNRSIDVTLSGTGSYSGGGTPGNGYGTCSSTYCHGSDTPSWGGNLVNSCDSCHSGQGAGTAASKSYTSVHNTKHTQSYQLACENCHTQLHSNPAKLISHAGGTVSGVQAAEVKYTDQQGTTQYGGGGSTFRYVNLFASPYGFSAPTPTYTAGGISAGTDPNNGNLSWTAGTCNSVWCHSNANPYNGANSYAAPTWTGTTDCGSCHSKQGDAAPTWSVPHSKHINGYNVNTNFTCNVCHGNTATSNSGVVTGVTSSHVNGAKDVVFSGFASPDSAATYSLSTHQCTNTYCHSNGSNPTNPTHADVTWSGSITDCKSCHGNDQASGSLISTGVHTQHVHNTVNKVGFDIGCTECHNATAADNSTLSATTGTVDHVNKKVNIKFNDGGGLNRNSDNPTYSGLNTTAADGAAVDRSGAGSCSNVYCHSIGNTDSTTGALISAGSLSFRTISWNSAGIACDGCHGNQAGKAHPAYDTGTPGSTTANSHVKHVENNNYTCEYCHNTTTVSTETSAATMTLIPGGTHLNRIEDVFFKEISGQTGTYDATIGQKKCSNTYCHGTAASPSWGDAGATNCASCHQNQGASTPASYSGKHTKHADTSTGYGFSCEECHATGGTTHAGGPYNAPNQTAEISFTSQNPTMQYNQQYRGSATALYRSMTLTTNPYNNGAIVPVYSAGSVTAADSQAPGIAYWTNGSCTNVWCHSNAYPIDGLNSYATPSWNNSLSQCNECHSRPADATRSWSSRHDKHLVTYSTNANFTCATCHANTASNNTTIITGPTSSHVNGMKDVKFNSFADPAGVNAGGYTKPNCTNTYCHSNGTSLATLDDPSHASVAWNGPGLGCDGCHGDANGRPNYLSGSPKANSHGQTKHAALACDKCHNATTTTGNSITTPANHVNQNYDISGATGTNFNMTYTFNQTGGTCGTNTYCHSNVQNNGGSAGTTFDTAKWGDASSAACATKCHTSTPQTGTHTKHLAQSGIVCDSCHSGAGTGTSKHANYSIDLSMSPGVYSLGSHTPGNGYGNCSSTYCHGSGTPAWGGSLTNSCDSCHSGQGAGTAASKSYTGAHTTKHTGSYLLACENCHTQLNSDTSKRISHAGGKISSLQAAEVKYTDQQGTTQYGGGGSTMRYVNLFSNPYGVVSQPSPTYSAGGVSAGTDPNNAGLSWTAGACNNIWCHSNANPTGGVNQFVSAQTWTGTLDCGGCHRKAGNTADMTTSGATGTMSGLHIKHAATDRYAFTCDECHAGTVANNSTDTISNYTTHVNGTKDWAFSTTLRSTTLDQSSGSYSGGNCSNIYCHSKGTVLSGTTFNQATNTPVTTPAWSTATLGCNGCHGDSSYTDGMPSYTTGSPKANSHNKHVRTSGYICNVCHSKTVDATNTILLSGATTSHINAFYDVTGTKISSFTYPGSTCANTCHGSGTPTWGAETTDADCVKCHGVAGSDVASYGTDSRRAAPGYYASSAPTGTGRDTGGNTDPSSAKVGAHDAHLRAAGGYTTAIACNTCHTVPSTPVEGNHLNGTVELIWSGLSNSAGLTPGYAGGTCSNTYCHGNSFSLATQGTGTAPVWTNTAYLSNPASSKNSVDCNRCHTSPPVASIKYDHSGLVITDDCSGCHNHNGSGSEHINGVLYGAGQCDTCHDYDTVNGDWGKSAKAVEGWGAHAKHIDHLKSVTGTVLSASTDTFGGPVFNQVCGACHTRLSSNHTMSGGSGRLINFGDGSTQYQFSTLATLTYSGVTGVSSATTPKTCSNVSCHFQATPVWQGY